MGGIKFESLELGIFRNILLGFKDVKYLKMKSCCHIIYVKLFTYRYSPDKLVVRFMMNGSCEKWEFKENEF